MYVVLLVSVTMGSLPKSWQASSDNLLNHPLIETKAQVIELALLSNVSELKVSFVPACITPDWHS